MIKSLGKFLIGVVSLTAIYSSNVAAAPIYEFEVNNPANNPAGGKITNIKTRYDSDNQTFSWQSTTEKANGQYTDGFWLVVSDGPDPKGHVNEYAIMYGDLATGTLTSYIYNGNSTYNTWRHNQNYIASTGANFINVSDNGTARTFNFELDTTQINSLFTTTDWDGVAFGEKIGIWYHPSIGSTFAYNADGSLKNFSVTQSGWYDAAHQTTTPISTPATISLFLMSVALVPFIRNRRRSFKTATA
ncbi:hypothetical protein H0A36_03020 [Endozoicomonas sp. SM1973]|uniref:PEP-CTERM sorting domain-containing protein n=1 Tax=Spartinivicinus marinus TaxID=2994442 RepID=A0A853I478_9GAMM|nr:hypothetical protein [Spartinivicinus marinus]MCX4029389.1 hypothetical protein [Spartinivicinus marinus]NYZ64964.1 hypothetical protein [Spartinivicinus marinus]